MSGHLLTEIELVFPLHLRHLDQAPDQLFVAAAGGVHGSAFPLKDVPALQFSRAVHWKEPAGDVAKSAEDFSDREEDRLAQRARAGAEVAENPRDQLAVMVFFLFDLPDAFALVGGTGATPVPAISEPGRKLPGMRVLEFTDQVGKIGRHSGNCKTGLRAQGAGLRAQKKHPAHGAVFLSPDPRALSPALQFPAVEHYTAFVFPGQGSQHAGMGKDVAERYPVARRVFESIDDALGFSISKLCFEGPEDQLKLTENTQPAILAVSSAIHAVLEEKGAVRRDIVAGHSLGEYSAIASVGGLTPAEAAKVVRLRGQFMQAAVPVGTGGMAALIGPTVEEARAICEEAAQGEIVSVANVNAPGQIVIAGTKAGIDRAIEVAKKRGVRRALPLSVSAPFHCELMKPAEERLRPVLEAAPFKDLWVSLVSNVDASPIGTATAVRNALLRQVASPVRWAESVERMVSMGVRRFVEVGPGSVLTGLIKRIDSSVELINISDAAGIEAYVERVNG